MERKPRRKAATTAKTPVPKARAKTPRKPAPNGVTRGSAPGRSIDADKRREMIAYAAYMRALKRGFESGDPTEDWLEAEREVDERLSARASR